MIIEPVINNILAAKICQGSLHFNGGDSYVRVFFGEEQGNDSGPRSWFEYPITGFYAAEVRKENAIEGKSVSFLLLNDGYDPGASQGNAVTGYRSHFIFSTYSPGRRLGFPSLST